MCFETQSFKAKNKKSNKNCLDCWERALFILFMPLEVIRSVRSPNKKKNYSPHNETCVHGRHLFLPYFFWIKLCHQFSKQSAFKTRPSTLAFTEVLNKGVRSKLVSRVFLLFGINIKERSNCLKESWDNACFRTNSELFLPLVLTSVVSLL